MRIKANATLTAASVGLVGLYVACGSQPDWSDVINQIQANKNTTTTGDTTAVTTGPSTTGDTTATTATTSGAGGAQGATTATTGGGGINTTGGLQTTGQGGVGTGPGGATGTGGGGGGLGGAKADAGSDGSVDKRAMDLIELKDALKNLNGFIYTNPCKFGNAGQDVTTLNGCQSADICWATADLGRFSENRTIQIGGPAGHVYDIDLNVLGVIEPRDYPPPPNCAFEPNQPQSTISVSKCMDGFQNSSSVTFNVYEFAVPAPAAKYYFNSVATHPPHRVDPSDNKFTFTVNAGSTIKFTMDDLNGGEIRNCTTTVAKSKYTTAANSPFGNSSMIVASPSIAQPFNGNWFQLSVIDARVR
jgi:hypothetical protein